MTKKAVATRKPAAAPTKKPAPAPTKKPAATRTKRAASTRKATPKAPPRPIPPAWQAVLDAMIDAPGVTRRRMFGADGLGLLGKYFAMEWQGSLVVKLPPERVGALVAAGVGTHFDPSGGEMGKPMTAWLQITDGARDWLPFVEEGLVYLASKATR